MCYMYPYLPIIYDVKKSREPGTKWYALLSTCHSSRYASINMEWTPPHPRRLPTTWEIHENRGKIRELDAKIADLKEQLEKLQRDRDVCASFISSFRRLPAEILCEIVLQAINKGQSPIRLSEVSASMRDAIIGMKQLWTTIYLYAWPPHYPVTVSQWTPIMTISPDPRHEVLLLQK
jgi:hypothetical protein